jgi:hypothetical protein
VEAWPESDGRIAVSRQAVRAARTAVSDASGTILLGNAPKDNLREKKDFGGMGE